MKRQCDQENCKNICEIPDNVEFKYVYCSIECQVYHSGHGVLSDDEVKRRNLCKLGEECLRCW